MILPVGFGSSAGGTPANAVENSLRFNSADSANLSRTPASAGNRRTFTFNAWVKRSTLGTVQQIIGQGTGVAGGGFCIYFNSNDTIRVYSGSNDYLITNAVFRDPSAWYMITVLVDTTQATAANRVRLFVNGIEQTYSATSYPAQNTDTTFNQALEHRISGNTSATYILNGYLTDIVFLDGYTPTTTTRTVGNVTQTVLTQLGEFDSSTGVWVPKAWTSAYGTNGFYLPTSSGATWSGFFDGSNDYLSVASNAAWQYGTGDFTLECWLLGTTSGSFSNQYIFGRYNTGASAYGALQIGNSTNIYWYYGNGGAYTFTLGTALTTNRWYHFAVSRSGTSLRFFLDGTQIGSTQTDSTNYSGTAEFRIINAHQTSATYFPGYISNVRVVKGSAVYTANFTPSTTPLTAITNTVLLTCQSSTFIDNSTNNFTITNNGGAITQLFSPFNFDSADDQSGNGNNWQPNNLDLRTTGVGADIMVDTPTNYGTDTGVGGEVRGNYCTMNPLTVPTLPTLANGNLDVSVSATGVKIAQGTFQFPSSGKWYYECTFNNASSGVNGMFIGITSPTRGPNVTRSTAGAYFFYASSSGLLNSNGTDIVTGLSTISANEVFKLAVDIDNSKVWIGRGSIWYNSSGGTTGDPAAGTNPTFSISAIGLTPMSGFDASSVSLSMNFGQRSFNTTAPSGFKALCTQNLDTPVIGATSATQANKYFNAILYNGNGNTGQTITGVGFQPDWVWLKNRNSTGGYFNSLFDAVRGAGLRIRSDSDVAEVNASAIFSAFTSDGFTFPAGQGNTIENDGNPVGNYVAWNWKANGAGSTNSNGTAKSSSVTVDSSTDTVTWNSHGMSDGQKIGFFASVMPGGLSAGTLYFVRDAATNTFKVAATSGGAAIDITSNGTTVTCHTTLTSTVSANTTSEFSIVTYTGTGSNTTVEHGLDIAPTFIITKRRNGVVGWPCLVKAANSGNGQNGRLNLNETANYADNVAFWNNTSPTSKVFSIGTSVGTNASGATMVAYCFAPVAGYSAFGSYESNNSTDGPFIYTGFLPKYIMFKRSSTGANGWAIFDAARNTFNATNNNLLANSTGTENSVVGAQPIDFTANGIKIRTSWSDVNGTGTYIYMAFAESPFKYALAR